MPHVIKGARGNGNGRSLTSGASATAVLLAALPVAARGRRRPQSPHEDFRVFERGRFRLEATTPAT